jgi:hypothetical protein
MQRCTLVVIGVIAFGLTPQDMSLGTVDHLLADCNHGLFSSLGRLFKACIELDSLA